MTPSRNRDLDRLRAIAIIFVLFSHLSLVFPWTVGRPLGWFAYLNFWTGVDLFFVISGFIVTKVLIQDLDRAAASGRTRTALKAFFVRRIFRIVPLAWLWVLIVLLISALFNESHSLPTPREVVSEFYAIALNVYNLGDAFEWGWLNPNGYKRFAPYWSLSIEEQFYISLPILLLAIRSRGGRLLFLLGSLVFIALVLRPVLVAADSGTNFFMKFTLTRLDPLICGCLLYFLSTSRNYSAIEPTVLRDRVTAKVVFGILCLFVATVPMMIGFDLRPGRFALVWPLLDAACALLVWIASYDRDYLFVGSSVERVFQWFGSRSYSIYLSHWPSIWFTQEVGYRLAGSLTTPPIGLHFWILYLGMFLVLALGLAEVLHRVVERPMNRRGHRLARAIDGRNVDVPIT